MNVAYSNGRFVARAKLFVDLDDSHQSATDSASLDEAPLTFIRWCRGTDEDRDGIVHEHIGSSS